MDNEEEYFDEEYFDDEYLDNQNRLKKNKNNKRKVQKDINNNKNKTNLSKNSTKSQQNITPGSNSINVKNNKTNPGGSNSASLNNKAGNITAKTGQTIKNAGNGMKAAGKTSKVAGKGMQYAGKGMQTAGKGISTAGQAVGSAASAIPVVGAPLGGIVSGASKLAGTGVQAAGKGTEALGSGLNKAGDKLDKAGQKTKETGNKISKTGNKLKKDAGKKIISKLNPIKDISPQKALTNSIKMNVALILGVFIGVILIFYFITSPVIDALDKFAEFLAGNDTTQKLGNLYSGLGYKTTEDAFYEEMEYLYNKSGGDLDLTLVLSALYYPETRNDYSTDYSIMDDNNNSKIKAIINELKDKYKDNNQYTQGMILRLRMLNSGMLENSYEGERMTLDEFKKQYGSIVTEDLKNTGDLFSAAILSANPVSEFVNMLKNAFNLVAGPTFITLENSTYNLVSNQLETISMGLRSISSMEFGLDENNKPQIYVTLYTKKYDEDKFKQYLTSYIRKMPEFKPFIKNLEGVSLDKEIEKIINEIYEHASWYTGVYGQINRSAESYNSVCSGGIPDDLVSELVKPVDVASDRQVKFNDSYAYGMRDGVMHNGIDINSDTTGTKEGDNVYAIASGKVISSEPKVKCNTKEDSSCTQTQGAWVRIKHSIMVDGNKYEFISAYMHLQANSGQPKVGSTVKKGDVIGKVGNTGDSESAHLHFEYRSDDGTDEGMPVDPVNLFVSCNSGSLMGDTDTEKIWWYFRSLGYSPVATAAAMGNLSAESGLISYRKQGDYNPPDYTESKKYTESVDNKTLSKNAFIHDSIGYGLAQWTYYTRKDALYKKANKEKTSIGDLQMQLDHIVSELGTHKKQSWYKQWYNSPEESIDTATELFCREFEKPGTPHLDERKKAAKAIYSKYKDKTAPSSSTVENPSTSVGSDFIYNTALQIKKYISDNKYTYGALQTEVKSAEKSRKVDCSSYVSWVLYKAGFTQFGGHQQTDRTFYSNSWKFKEVKIQDAKPGDILIYSGHVEIFSSYTNKTLKVLNAGSNNSIRVSGVTTSYYNIGQIRKILRVEK